MIENKHREAIEGEGYIRMDDIKLTEDIGYAFVKFTDKEAGKALCREKHLIDGILIQYPMILMGIDCQMDGRLRTPRNL